MRRTNAVKPAVDGETNEKLRELGTITAKCWNEVNRLRMQQFRKGERVDFARTEREAYGKYRHVLKVNAQQVARKNAENWRGFFSLIKAKKEGKLPRWFKPILAGYWRDESGKYKLMIVIRNDRYEVDENRRVIHLKDFNLTLGFKGKLKWHGKRGRLEVIYNEARRSWYARITVKVGNVAEARGSLRAGVDLGIVNLATVYVEDDKWYIFKGGGVLSQYEYYSKKISRVQKVLARHGQRTSRRLKLLYDKRKKFLRHALNSMVRKIMEELKERGVSRVVVGYPRDTVRNHGSKLTVNFWNYDYTIRRFKEIGEELGIGVIDVAEPNTSKSCSLCGESHESGNQVRSL